MGYEPKPHGNIDEEDGFTPPWIELIVTIAFIYAIWYSESEPIQKFIRKNRLDDYWKEPVILSKKEKFVIIIKQLIVDIKHNPLISLFCGCLIIYKLIRCFIGQ